MEEMPNLCQISLLEQLLLKIFLFLDLVKSRMQEMSSQEYIFCKCISIDSNMTENAKSVNKSCSYFLRVQIQDGWAITAVVPQEKNVLRQSPTSQLKMMEKWQQRGRGPKRVIFAKVYFCSIFSIIAPL